MSNRRASSRGCCDSDGSDAAAAAGPGDTFHRYYLLMLSTSCWLSPVTGFSSLHLREHYLSKFQREIGVNLIIVNLSEHNFVFTVNSLQ